jgi:hypothetical protein
VKKRAASRGKYPSKPRYWNSDIQELEAGAKSARQEYACAAFYDPNNTATRRVLRRVIGETSALLHSAIRSAPTAAQKERIDSTEDDFL